MGVLSWALDRIANATADPTIPAQDGASARSFMDMLRGIMAGSRALADDQGGSITTGGVQPNVYTVMTASGVSALRPGLSFLVKIDRSNTDAATLNIDGTGPVPWRDADGREFGAGVLPSGRFVRITYDGARRAWLSDVLALNAFDLAFAAWMASLPSAPDGLGPNKAWKMGDAVSGYTLNLTGTNT